MKNAVSIHEICDKFPRLTDYFGVMVNNIMHLSSQLIYWKRYFNYFTKMYLYFCSLMRNLKDYIKELLISS